MLLRARPHAAQAVFPRPVFGDDRAMSILYPVADNPTAALNAPVGRAAREREAAGLAAEAVSFVTEPAGPAFATREAALDAYRGRLEDERPGAAVQVAPEDRYCQLAEVAVGGRRPAPVQPSFKDGRRWPAPPPAPPTAWRLMVSYWRPVSAAPQAAAPQARHARRKSREPHDNQALRAMARQPMQPVKPQQPLDIGLFETRLPESPHIVVPDE
jgi:hypothetical protein